MSEERPPDGSRQRTVWDQLLLGVIAFVGLYGITMVIAAEQVSRNLFGPLGFGLDQAGALTATELDYVAFVFRVLGAVIVGWMVALAGITVVPLRRREPWAWWTVASSMVVWFTVDTGMSVAVGQHSHAVFNLAFLFAMAVPLGGIGMQLRSGSSPDPERFDQRQRSGADPFGSLSATTMPASQPGARPPGGIANGARSISARHNTHETTEFEFHISPAPSSSRPHTGVGTDGSRSITRRA